METPPFTPERHDQSNVLREKIPFEGYETEEELLKEIKTRLEQHNLLSDHLLLAGHATPLEAGGDPRQQTFAQSFAEYEHALKVLEQRTPLFYAETAPGAEGNDAQPTVSIYDGTKPERDENYTHIFLGKDGATVDDALIAEFDVSEWART